MKCEKMFGKLKPGDYAPQVYEKGVNEACGIKGLKKGDVFWTVRLEEGSGYDTLSQSEAILISMLFKIENMLKRLESRLKKVEGK